jgi:hypothetical protein
MMKTKPRPRWIIPTLLLLLISIAAGPVRTYAQGSSLAELPLTEQYVTKYQGNYCVVSGGASLLNTTSAQFDLNVPGQPVAAFWNWSGRFIQNGTVPLPPQGDSEIQVTGTLGDGSPINTTITATVEQTSDPVSYIRWYAYIFPDDIFQFVRPGVNSYTVSDFALPPGGRIDTHGVALTVVYEDANCPFSQIELDYGLDTFYWQRTAPYGPNSSVACVALAPSPDPRILDYTMIVAGIADEGRPHAIWMASLNTPSSGLPNNLVGEAFASSIANPFGHGDHEWDIYSNQLTINPNDNYACFQIESTPGGSPGGVSGGWLSLNTALEVPVASIGDLIWSDINGDGVKDATEPGLAGVQVTLTGGAAPQQATTDANGLYIFPNLIEGVYTVTIDPNSGDLATGSWLQTGDPDGGFDNQSQVTLPPGVDDLDQDFGYQPLGSIGDTVWNDKNSNGAIDGGEQGIPGVTVTLRDASGPIATATTDPNGLYIFNNLPAGQYEVIIDPATLPPNMIPTYDPDGIDTPDQVTLLLGAGQDRDDIDFGYRSILVILGDTVWDDLNGNAAQDPGEPGINGVRVILTAPDSSQQVAITNASGFYNFTDLPAGTYTVSIDTATLPAGYGPTYDLDGIQTPDTTQVAMSVGVDRDDVDFGYMSVLGSIGDVVWRDDNNNQIQDPGEPGIPNVTVTLTAPDNSQQTATTDANGHYNFIDLPAGQYVINIDPATLPPNVIPTYDLDGIDTPNQATLTLADGQDRVDADFGYQQLGSLGDTVWNDMDGNGVQDPGEPGIPHVTVLLNAPGVVKTAITDSVGHYTFSDLPPLVYTVSINTSTLPDDLNKPTYDLDGIQTPNTTSVNLDPSQNRTDVDFGYQTPTAIDDDEEPDNDATVLVFIFLPLVNGQ